MQAFGTNCVEYYKKLRVKMSVYTKFARGAEWRRWDFHVHTKNTGKNDRFTSKTFDDFFVIFFKKAIEFEIEAIGVTDYFSIENYLRIKKLVNDIDSSEKFTVEEKEKIKDIFIFPNVELRMLPSTDKARLINIHCIFNPLYVESLENDFFGSVEFSGKGRKFKMNRRGMTDLGKSIDQSLNDEKAYIKGVNSFVLSHTDLQKLLDENSEFRENSIIIVSNSSKDGASAINKHFDLFENDANSSLDAVRKSIYNISDCIFSSNEEDRKYFLGEKSDNTQAIIQKCGSLKPCLHGSDAHTEDDLFKPKLDRYCWVKADLTFEGLKQIIFEPSERVIIQHNKPEEKAGYHAIDSVTLYSDDKFWNQTIFLNSNLNTIIGGRSTGKSTLLASIGKKIDKTIDLKDDGFVDNHINNINILWQDGEQIENRDIDFFPQNHMYEIAKDTVRTDRLIEKILKEKDQNRLLRSYESFCSNNKSDLVNKAIQLFQLQNKIIEQLSELKEVGDKEGITNEILLLENKIEKSNSENSVSPKDLESYENLLKTISEEEQEIKLLTFDIEFINLLIKKNIINSSLEYEFNSLSDYSRTKIYTTFEAVSNTANQQWSEFLEKETEALSKKIEELNKSIKTSKQADEYIKGEHYLEENKQYKEFQNKLNDERKKHSKILEIEKTLGILRKQREDQKLKIVSLHAEYLEQANILKNSLTLECEGLSIKPNILFRKNDMLEFFRERLSQKGATRQKFISDFIDSYETKISENTEDFINGALEHSIDYKGSYHDKFQPTVLSDLVSQNWFSITYDLTYQNDLFKNMSQGKQAFVILKLLLEFSEKKCPILIDQPEDSLDNRAIYNELVTYLKEKKKKRQIILVTHNPNVVVGADAEQIIVANQHGLDCKNKNSLKFQYVAGSLEFTNERESENDIILESQGIRQHVCELLEGGDEAFIKRELKYSLNK